MSAHRGERSRASRSTGLVRKTGALSRILLAGVLAAPLLAFGLWLAAHHPISGGAAVTATMAIFLLMWWRPMWSLVLIPAAIPLLSFAPWTGWMTVEELDVGLLAAMAGAWFGLVHWRGRASVPGRDIAGRDVVGTEGAANVWWVLAAAYAVVVLIGVQRGLADAGAWPLSVDDWGWWQGWREPMNSIRQAKGFVMALLLWPLWQALQTRSPQAASRALERGLLSALAVVSLLATAERFVWTGLTNFSTDYRTTALFWEMHVGGAALDAFMALMLPIVLLTLKEARAGWRWALSLGIGLLASYALLTTFSRGLYLAAVLSLGIWSILEFRRSGGSASGGRSGLAKLGVSGFWIGGFAAGAWWVFAVGGYRGLFAWWGLFALLFAGWAQMVPKGKGESRRDPTFSWMPVAFGLVGGSLLTVAALLLPPATKAPYLLFAALLLAGVCAAVYQARWPRAMTWPAFWVACLPAAAGVTWHWSESPNRWWILLPVAGLAIAASTAKHAPALRGGPGRRWRALAVAAMAFVGLLIASLGGGAYLEGRMATADQDWQGRLGHWNRSSSLLQTWTDEALGLGIGRFPARFALSGEASDQTGDYRWQGDPLSDERSVGHLVLTGGKHTLGLGEVFRMSQHVDSLPPGPVSVSWRSRVESDASLHVEICQKHLLYDSGCRTAHVTLTGIGWQEGQLLLNGPALPTSPVFSVAVYSQGKRIELDDLSAVDAQQRSLLVNGGFDNGLARWFPSSDRHHMPWHAKNLGIHLLVEQGWVGVLAFGTLLVFSLSRLAFGRVREHPLAPVIAAGVVGLLIVGLFDSVIDNPRVAFAYWLLLGIGATLRRPPAHAASLS